MPSIMDYNEIRQAISDSSFTDEHYRRLVLSCMDKIKDPRTLESVVSSAVSSIILMLEEGPDSAGWFVS